MVRQIKKDFVVAEHDFKSKGGDKKYGYFGSHHFLVKIGGLLAEIQVMQKRLWAYKEAAHQIYNKYRSDTDATKTISDEIRKLDIALSKELFSRGNARKNIRR